MNVERSTSSGAVIEYLRREAPFEFERLRSISRLEASWDEWTVADQGPGDPTYRAWLRGTFRIPPEFGLPLQPLTEDQPT